jgi:hypothetical protein
VTASIISFPPKQSALTPEVLADLFGAALEALEKREDADADPSFPIEGKAIHAATVFDLLAYCTVTMPPDLCNRVDLLLSWPDRCAPNSNYSHGALLVSALLRERGAP